MFKVKSRPWPVIAKFYREMAAVPHLVFLKPMLELVEHIERADFAPKVFGSTSHPFWRGKN
jgi:hypothetical protein